MEERNYLIELYDIYGELFTTKNQNYFEDYYFNNLSLSEIAENNSISRNAIHKQIKNTEKELIRYEKILKIHKKNENIDKIIININDEKVKKQLLELK